MRNHIPCTALLIIAIGVHSADGAATFHAGFAKADITPEEPLRLAGYGSRDQPSEGVDEPLFARVMVLRQGEGPIHVLVSVDTIGFPGTLTKRIHDRVSERHGIDRKQFVIACTHSHTAPQIRLNEEVAFAGNLFAVPLTEQERDAAEQYTRDTADAIVAAVAEAIDALAPARLFVGEGEASFASNRRVLESGVWAGFGVNPDGPVDRSLPFLKITDPSGEDIRGIVFNYACHCTTFGGDYNRVNGDWAGYAAKYLEETYDGAVALCTIGCGADANPHRDRQRALELAQAEGREIADEITGLITEDLAEITAAPRGTFGYAGLPIDRPSLDELRNNLNANQPQVRRHAENMLAIHERMGRLPETYPMPIQIWRFGDQFAMVFLGGEVVVDYALRIKDELEDDLALEDQREASARPAPPVWVTAYANDVFGYVASERMRAEGGYEVDYSMIYYNQPGRWSSGTEEVVLRRVHELFEDSLVQGPLSPDEAIGAFVLPPGFSIEVVAAEPLIRDPVNFAVGPDGRLWVVEMGDYPRGAAGEDRQEPETPWEGPPGGRIRVLTDVDGDGRYDEAVTFLDGLTFPTGVIPWRDGALVTNAPDIYYAEDVDGDGRADVHETLFTGFIESNPQHRVNGFEWGLDNWLYVASGASSGDIQCLQTGEVVNVSGRDMRLKPDEGLLEPVSGRTQYGRSRDDWGDWFGCTNSQPLFHFVISDRYLRRNPYVVSPTPVRHLPELPHPPAVYPSSRTLDRFNDLFASNRFTSACGASVFRDATLGEDVQGAALICEPVHNLVSRLMLIPDGVSFRGERHESEQESEFLSSRDNWFRPARLQTGPDGALWIADMYRMVIEHPQWIPEAWQAKLDLYAGHDRGRIYRMFRDDAPPAPIPNLARLPDEELVAELLHTNGWRRDTAHRLLVQRDSLAPQAGRQLEITVIDGETPLSRLHALCILDGRGTLAEQTLIDCLREEHPGVVRETVRVSEAHAGRDGVLLEVLSRLAAHDDVRIRYQLALSLGEFDDPRAGDLLSRLLIDNADNEWIRAAVLSSAAGHAERILAGALQSMPDSSLRTELVGRLVATALGPDPPGGAAAIITHLGGSAGEEVAEWQFAGLSACFEALTRQGLTAEDVFENSDAVPQIVARITEAARESISGAAAADGRAAFAIGVLAYDPAAMERDLSLLSTLLTPRTAAELQTAAITALSRSDHPSVPQILFDNYRSASPEIRAQMLSALLGREAWTLVLLDRIERDELSVGELDAATRNRLLEHDSAMIRERAEQLLGEAANPDRQSVIDANAGVIEMSGDPARGAQVFEKRCAACHRIGDIGRDVGAPLAALKDKSSQFLLTAILDPNRAVEAKYTAYAAATLDGRVISGMVVEETATSLTFAAADGTRHTILRVDLDQLAATGKSFMPEGLEQDLSAEDLADVIAFIQEHAAEQSGE